MFCQTPYDIPEQCVLKWNKSQQVNAEKYKGQEKFSCIKLGWFISIKLKLISSSVHFSLHIKIVHKTHTFQLLLVNMCLLKQQTLVSNSCFWIQYTIKVLSGMFTSNSRSGGFQGKCLLSYAKEYSTKNKTSYMEFCLIYSESYFLSRSER